MHNKMSLISSFFIFLMVNISCTDNAANGSRSKTQDTKVQSVPLGNSDPASDLSEKIYKSFDATRPVTGESIYPDYWGGSYYGDKDKLYALIKGDMNIARKDMQNRVGNLSVIEFIPCEYSFQELCDFNNELGKLYENEKLRNKLGWTSVGVYVSKNRVVVYLSDCSEKNISLFKEKVSNSPMIMFEGMKDITFLSKEKDSNS